MDTIERINRYTGLVIRESAQEVTIKTATDAEPIAIATAEIAKRTTEKTSIMPGDIADKATDNGVRDVTAYLLTTPAK